MRKFAAVALLALGLAVVPSTAGAAPIGTNGCTLTAVYECSIFADYQTGLSVLDNGSSGWLVAYTFLLNVGADLTDGIQVGDVAHALVIHDWGFELFTPLVGSTAFQTVVGNALGGVAIDGTDLSLGQIVGAPVFNGSTQLNGVGYFFTAPTVSMENQIAWSIAGEGGYDTLFVHTSLPTPPPPPPPTGVPEPASILLVALGGAGVFLAPRRRRA